MMNSKKMTAAVLKNRTKISLIEIEGILRVRLPHLQSHKSTVKGEEKKSKDPTESERRYQRHEISVRQTINQNFCHESDVPLLVRALSPKK